MSNKIEDLQEAAKEEIKETHRRIMRRAAFRAHLDELLREFDYLSDCGAPPNKNLISLEGAVEKCRAENVKYT